MKKSLFGIVVIVFSIFVSLTITETALGYFFGGHIINTEAPEVTVAEAAGYKCEMQGGSTLEIWSIMGPTSYFIPTSIYQVTETTPASGQQILGLYEGQTTITCTKYDEGDNKDTSRIEINLDNISYFGTSAR